jgi:hypothetical protein
MYGYQKFMAFLQTERDKKTIGMAHMFTVKFNTKIVLYF